jgi:hypothetical protein
VVAVEHLQSAVAGAVSCEVWETLATCYMWQEKHTPALKTFQQVLLEYHICISQVHGIQALEFDSESIYPLLGCAHSFKKLSLIEDSVAHYTRAYNLCKANHVIADVFYVCVCGLCEALLAQAQVCYECHTLT